MLEADCNLQESVADQESCFPHFRNLRMTILPRDAVLNYSDKLCRQSKLFYESFASICTTEDELWDKYINELWMHLLDPKDCRNFENYHRNRWQPKMFWWPTVSSITYKLQSMIDDDLWREEWANPILAGINFVPFMVENVIVDFSVDEAGSPDASNAFALRHDRIFHVHHMFVLHIATGRAFLPRSFSQIVEFGGGTGDNIAMLREMGFTGLHVIYDFMPMLLAQQFFAGISSWPSYLAHNLTHSTLHGRRTLLMPCGDSSRLTQALAPPRAARTLFLATWSLSESPLHTRKEVLDRVLGYGVTAIFITLQREHGLSLVDNVQWAIALAGELTSQYDYQICLWRMRNEQADLQSFYLVAVRRKEGEVLCLEAVGCTRETIVASSASCFSSRE